jgi:hypothetical protein
VAHLEKQNVAPIPDQASLQERITSRIQLRQLKFVDRRVDIVRFDNIAEAELIQIVPANPPRTIPAFLETASQHRFSVHRQPNCTRDSGRVERPLKPRDNLRLLRIDAAQNELSQIAWCRGKVPRKPHGGGVLPNGVDEFVRHAEIVPDMTPISSNRADRGGHKMKPFGTDEARADTPD